MRSSKTPERVPIRRGSYVEKRKVNVKPSPGRELIDLGGRQDEPAVRRVLGQSHGSTEALEEACAHYRSGEWTFIGWQEGEEILACAGAERGSAAARSGSARLRLRPGGETAVLAARS